MSETRRLKQTGQEVILELRLLILLLFAAVRLVLNRVAVQKQALQIAK
jgi:hypothetical protein